MLFLLTACPVFTITVPPILLYVMKKFKPLLSLTCPFLAVFLLTQCGGGKGGEDLSTVRPKTMDGITLTLDTNVFFDFIGGMNSPRAINNGDVETGTFFYRRGGSRFRKYPNARNTVSNSDWPDGVNTPSYSYRAINASSGILTLKGVATGGLPSVPAGQWENNESWASFFRYTSPWFDTNDTNTIVLDITFSDQGTIITSNVVTLRIPETEAEFATLDTLRINSTIRLTDGGGVPPNYNPTIDPDRPSRIAPETLDNKLMVATNGIPNPALDFTLQFTRDSGGIGFGVDNEIGRVILRITTSPIDNAADYTWERIGGTDSGTLTLSNSGTFFDGAYNLDFIGRENGIYTGDTPQQSGTFTIAPAP